MNEKWLRLLNRKREAKAITRVGCMARLRIKYDINMRMYVVTEFVDEHNIG